MNPAPTFGYEPLTRTLSLRGRGSKRALREPQGERVLILRLPFEVLLASDHIFDVFHCLLMTPAFSRTILIVFIDHIFEVFHVLFMTSALSGVILIVFIDHILEVCHNLLMTRPLSESTFVIASIAI